MQKSIVLLAGGGPAPGINTVIATVAKVFFETRIQSNWS
jgi:6-phosphofructokinase